MQLAMIVRLASQVTSVGLDFFEAVAGRVIAVGASAHAQGFELPFQGDFRFIARAPPGNHAPVAFDAFLGCGRRREAQVQVTHLGAELAQRPYGHAVAHAASLQRT